MLALRRHQDTESWLPSPGSHIYYREASSSDTRSRGPLRSHTASSTGFPSPLIGNRRTRPHSIHILTYPPGYVPRELRPQQTGAAGGDKQKQKRKKRQQSSGVGTRSQADRGVSDVGITEQTAQKKTKKTKKGYQLARPVLRKLFTSSASSSSTLSTVPAVTSCALPQIDNNSAPPPSSPPPPAPPPPPVPDNRIQEVQQSPALIGVGTGTDTCGGTNSAVASPPTSAAHRHSAGILTGTYTCTDTCAGTCDTAGIRTSENPETAYDIIPTARHSPPRPAPAPSARRYRYLCSPPEQHHHHHHPPNQGLPETDWSSTPPHPLLPTPPPLLPQAFPLQSHTLLPQQDSQHHCHHHHHHIPSSSSSSSSSSSHTTQPHRHHSTPPPPFYPSASTTTTTTAVTPNRLSSTTMTSTMMASRLPAHLPIAAPTNTNNLQPSPYSLPTTASHRNSLMSVRSAKSAVTSLVTEVPKPVASGSGVSCSILLAEPDIFLSGFDHDHNSQRRPVNTGTALLRGKLQLSISKNVKIKAVQLKLLGRARTEWPEGIPPLKQDMFEEEGLRTQVLTFFNAMNDGWSTDYGNQCVFKLKDSSANSSTANLAATATSNGGRPTLASPIPSSHSSSSFSARNNLTTKDLKRLSLQNNQSRSFGKGDNPLAATPQAKGFKVFYPGVYEYSFELPIDHHQLETTKLQYGSVKWELHATVDRAGAFKPNLHGMKEVSIVRVPDSMSLEMVEPISISRQWEDQLHYDIIISGKSFPIGSKIPIAFKLTPLAKVQVHKLKVFVTESIEYWTNDKRVTRKDPGRKILLLEKSAGKPLDQMWSASEVRTVRGGEPSPEARETARQTASRRRQHEASLSHTDPEPLPEPSANLLGDLDLGLEHMWGSTEIEANVQIPTCEMMAKNKSLRLHPDCSWKNVNVFHWIKVVMRISRLDPDDPTGKKRRHFEISIDSPFTVLDCRATQANTNLPAYAGAPSHGTTYQSACGCPDAATVATNASPSSSTGSLLEEEATTGGLDVLPAPPQAAHVHTDGHMNPATMSPTVSQSDAAGSNGPRPIHLLRVPSFNPPAFDDDTAPPPAAELVHQNPEAANAPLVTPPPQYDVVVGTPSVDGMADYFNRLADYGYDPESDSGSDSDTTMSSRILERSGRVNVAHPRTPGGRMPSRSFEISRPAVNLDLNSLRDRAGERTPV